MAQGAGVCQRHVCIQAEVEVTVGVLPAGVPGWAQGGMREVGVTQGLPALPVSSPVAPRPSHDCLDLTRATPLHAAVSGPTPSAQVPPLSSTPSTWSPQATPPHGLSQAPPPMACQTPPVQAPPLTLPCYRPYPQPHPSTWSCHRPRPQPWPLTWPYPGPRPRSDPPPGPRS